MTATQSRPPLGGYSYRELYQADGLARLDADFQNYLRREDAALAERLTAYRRSESQPPPRETSELLLALSPYLEIFIARLFDVERPLAEQREATLDEDLVLKFKHDVVAKRARRYRQPIESSFAELDQWLGAELRAAGLAGQERERAVAAYAERLAASPEQRAEEALERLTQWCALALDDPEGREAVRGWASFQLPHKVDHAHLVPLQRADAKGVQRYQAPAERQRRRDGFKLTDPRMDRRHAQGEVHYCVYCHDHNGDFCSKGFPEKKKQPELGLKRDPLGNILTGCPLEEKISEMHVLKRDGRSIAALAMAMVDNPMVPATGHRICNDCMKACIYQKQDPVNIPETETRILTDVLGLPWGVEIYDLLTRWNPLRREQYVMQPYSGHKVLVAGMGPAGFTMAHHLTMEGCAVLGIDGLKIEPLPGELIEQPVRDWESLREPLDERILWGFGGVAEYGITVRWDKNFLKLIYLVLARRPYLQIKGGVRLGGTITVEDAWELGFDHLCMATGAGYPRVIHMGNSLARGMRQANDFLMALQLTGAGKISSLANLQVRLPAVVIGGGLTGVDTATEVQAHYVKQVEKVLDRHERLVEIQGEEAVRRGLNAEDAAILDEFLEHGRAVRAERRQAAEQGREPDFAPLLREWGGVTIAYRKGLNDSPAYTRNHEEVIKATEEGLYYAPGLEPIHAELDEHDHVRSLVFRRMRSDGGRWMATAEEVRLPARAVFVAAGTVPNTIYEHEHPGHFRMEGSQFEAFAQHPDGLQPVQPPEHCKAREVGPFTSYEEQQRYVTFLGDTHPMFNGSVVKAIASSKRSWPLVMRALKERTPGESTDEALQAFQAQMQELFTATVVEVKRDNPAVVEMWVKAPMAAKNFRPGQFFRLQTYESRSRLEQNTRLQVPLMTVSGTGIEGDKIRLMVLQWGAAPRIAGLLQPGDELVLMGPTGAPTDIPDGKTILVVAGRWGAAVMHDIGSELRAAGNRVIYLAAFGRASDVDHQDELEAAADQIIWATAQGPEIEPRRPQDISVTATDMVELLEQYGDGRLGGDGTIPLAEVDRLMVMGGTGLLRGFQQALSGRLQRHFPSRVQAIGTVGSPMQCMLKGVCSQCLQWQIDPETGERTRPVFSCAEQDQPLAWIDLDNLGARQGQNRLLDRLTGQWVNHLLER